MVNNRVFCPWCTKPFCWVCLTSICASSAGSVFDHFSTSMMFGCNGFLYRDMRGVSLSCLVVEIIATILFLPLCYLYLSTKNSTTRSFAKMEECLMKTNKVIKVFVMLICCLPLFTLILAFHLLLSVLMYPLGVITQIKRVVKVCVRNSKHKKIIRRLKKLDKIDLLANINHTDESAGS